MIIRNGWQLFGLLIASKRNVWVLHFKKIRLVTQVVCEHLQRGGV